MKKNINKLALIVLIVSLFISCMTTSGETETLIKPEKEESKPLATEVKTTTDTKVEPIVIEKTQSEKPINKAEIEKKEIVTENTRIVVTPEQPKNNAKSTTSIASAEKNNSTSTVDKVEVPTTKVKTTKEVEKKSQDSSSNDKKETEVLSLGSRIARVALVFSIIIFGLLFILIRIILYFRRKRM